MRAILIFGWTVPLRSESNFHIWVNCPFKRWVILVFGWTVPLRADSHFHLRVNCAFKRWVIFVFGWTVPLRCETHFHLWVNCPFKRWEWWLELRLLLLVPWWRSCSGSARETQAGPRSCPGSCRSSWSWSGHQGRWAADSGPLWRLGRCVRCGGHTSQTCEEPAAQTHSPLSTHTYRWGQ